MPVGEVSRERALDGLFVAEGAIESFVERKTPAFDQRPQLCERRQGLDRIAKGRSAATERAEPYRDALHVAEHGSDARAGGGKRSVSASRAAAKLSGKTNGAPTGPPRTS